MRNERGLTLLEIIIALGLLGVIVVAFLGAMAGASRAMFVADERATAESLARSEMEYVKSQDYDAEWNYTVSNSERSFLDEPSWWDINNPPLLSSDYANYSVTIDASENELEDGLQKITITVYHNNEPVFTSDNFTLEGYKVDR